MYNFALMQTTRTKQQPCTV